MGQGFTVRNLGIRVINSDVRHKSDSSGAGHFGSVKELRRQNAKKPCRSGIYVSGPVFADYSVHGSRVVKFYSLTQEEQSVMNTDQVKGKFKQLSGEIKRKWGQVTDDDFTQAQGSIEKLIGKTQERSGDRREAIEKWLKSQGMND